MSPSRNHARGFTLIEVMIALAILGVGLVILIRSISSQVFIAQESQIEGIATELARAKVYDIEEQLMDEGFMETDQSSDGDFDDEGWPTIKWSAKVEKVELPSFDSLQAMAEASAAGSGSAGSGSAGSGSAGEFVAPGGFGDSALGGMLGMLGGGGGTDPASAGGASFIQSQYTLVQDVLKASIRKVTLTISWTVVGRDRSFDVVAFFTDPAGMTKTIGNLGVQ